MEMLQAHSMEDIESMPKTKWNISQPNGVCIFQQCKCPLKKDIFVLHRSR